MSIVQAFYGVSLLVLALPGSALAADSTPAEAKRITAEQTGVSTDGGSNGFVLVTLGTWVVADPPKQGLAAPTPNERLTASSAKNSGKVSNFRRAIYLQHVREAEQRYALPAGLLDALIWTESRYNPMALSKAGAAGLGQLMPATALDMGVTNRYDPFANILGAAHHLRQMLDRFGSIKLAVAAYNAGPAAVLVARGIPTNNETPIYVQSVLNFWSIFS